MGKRWGLSRCRLTGLWRGRLWRRGRCFSLAGFLLPGILRYMSRSAPAPSELPLIKSRDSVVSRGKNPLGLAPWVLLCSRPWPYGAALVVRPPTRRAEHRFPKTSQGSLPKARVRSTRTPFRASWLLEEVMFRVAEARSNTSRTQGTHSRSSNRIDPVGASLTALTVLDLCSPRRLTKPNSLIESSMANSFELCVTRRLESHRQELRKHPPAASLSTPSPG